MREKFIKQLKKLSIPFERTDKGIIITRGGYVNLNSLTSLPQGTEFKNGGSVYLRSDKISIRTPYIDRFILQRDHKSIFLFKKVSRDFKTQENTINETLWKIGTTLNHPNWQPDINECGEGKYHACAYPHWTDKFRSLQNDRYIKIKVRAEDLYEWTDYPEYPQKIAFRSAEVICEVTRDGEPIART